MNLQRGYTILLRLYPPDHRAMFAAEMLTVFTQAADARREQGWSACARFVFVELIGVAREAAAERHAKLAYEVYRWANLARIFSLPAEWVAQIIYALYRSNSAFRCRCVPDLRMMRLARIL
jgi:hypothetical protein